MLKLTTRSPAVSSTFTLANRAISKRLLSQSQHLLISKAKLTLFAKDGCSLCDKARAVCEEVRSSKDLQNPISFQYVDITDTLNKEWWDAYCFDVPVLHLEKEGQELKKFMHYLDAGKIADAVNEK